MQELYRWNSKPDGKNAMIHKHILITTKGIPWNY